MSFCEKTVSSETIFRGKVVTLQVDTVQLPNGKLATREIVKHSGAVAVLAVTDDERLILVRQFRKPLERELYEIPAGKLEPGEDSLACAQRELLEETGYSADRFRHLASFYTSPGFADELLHVYRAEGLRRGEARPDEDEFVETVSVTLEEAYALIAAEKIRDAKTVFAVYAWQNELLRRQLAALGAEGEKSLQAKGAKKEKQDGIG
ncbi:ADP-ribose pyrophosphatase [Bacillaceae bacterium]